MNKLSSNGGVVELFEANELMVMALEILDRQEHPAAAYLDHAVVKLGLRPDNEGMPASLDA